MELLKKAQTLVGREVCILLKQSPNLWDVKGVLKEVDKDGVLILTYTYNESSLRDSEAYIHISTIGAIFRLKE